MDVNIVGAGANDNVEVQVDPTFQSMRSTVRPLEYQDRGTIGGHFYLAASFSTNAAALTTNSQIFSLRWADSKFLFVLHHLTIQAAVTTAFTTIQSIDWDVIAARSFSTNPSGGAAISIATTAQKARSSNMSGSILASEGAIAISSGGPLTPGTQTLDTQPFGYAITHSLGTKDSTIGGAIGPLDLFNLRDFGEHPMVFGNNEGFVVRNEIAHGAAGVVKVGLTLGWAEVPVY